MPNVTARIKIKDKHYEISVDLEEALKIRNEDSKANIMSALQSPKIFHDLKKGDIASQSDLKEAFKTADVYEIAKKIIQKGEVQKTQEFRDEQRGEKVKQILALLQKNAVDQNGNPYTEERLKRAINEVHYSFDSRPAEQQLPELVHKLKEIIPIKIETKRIKLTIPAQFTGQVYGLLQSYKENEEWLSNGSLQVIISIPSGMQIDFYEKLNDITHGAVQSEELKENQ